MSGVRPTQAVPVPVPDVHPGDGALAGLRVVEWASGFGTPLCARLLGDLGADVVKVETDGGDWLRETGIFPALNYNKRGVRVDPTSAAGLDFIRSLIASADIVVENHPPGFLNALGLGFDALQQLRPGIVLASITPFGQTGPRSSWKGEDLVGCHAGGLAWLVPEWVDDPKKPPLRPAPRQAELQAALNGVIGTLGAIYGRERGAANSGSGVHVDVSTQECVAAILHTSLPEYVALGRVRDRFAPSIVFSGFTRARDGYVRFFCVTEEHWRKLGELIGAAELVDVADPRERLARRAAIEARAAAWASSRTKQEFYHLAQRLRLPFAPVNSPEEVLHEPQLLARGSFVQVETTSGTRLLLPGAPFYSAVTPWRVRRRAPEPGEHDKEVRAELAVRKPAVNDERMGNAIGQEENGPYLPLAGLRVIDFSWAWAGPHCAIQLADMGAEVIKVESATRMDNARTVGPYPAGDPVDPNGSLRFAFFNRGKAGVTLNLREREAVELAKQLVTVADVVVENFAPGVMDRLGLGYEALRAVRDDLIMVSLSGFGATGPERDYVAYGYTIEAFAGMAEQTGYPGGGPEPVGLPYADPAGGLMGAIAVLAALRHRLRTGVGQQIDLAESETLLTCLTEGYALQALSGREPPRTGNADRFWAPHGVYPCREGRWLAIAVTSDAEWRALVGLMGSPDWAASGAAELATRNGRLERQMLLDRHIAAWTAEHDAEQLAVAIQAAGVPATVSQNARDVLEDPHLAARGYFQQVDHPGLGPRPVFSAPYRFGPDPLPIRRAAPLLGEDNRAILGSLLGLPDQTLADLAVRRVLD